ncbi:MAG TPA: hypothetical protein VGF79_09070 [Bacteroidia bacterium]
MKTSILLLFTLVLFSCSKDNSKASNAFSIISCTKTDAKPGSFATLSLTVKNNSNLEMGCWAYIKIKKNGVIIETDNVVYSSLNPGETQVEEAWLSKINTHSEYDVAEVKLTWNVDSFSYSRTYNY